MNILNTTVRAVIKRPFIIILPAIVMLLWSAINAYNPILPVITGIASITGGTALDSLVYVIQLLMDPSIFPVILILFAAGTLLASLIAGLVLSGYFNVIASVLEGKSGGRGIFREGLKRYFSRYFFISLRAVPFMGLLAAFMLVSSIPAIIVTKAVTADKPELLLAAVFVDILTIAVLFFGFIFSRIYIFFWYPAAMKAVKRPFTFGKRVADGHFWGIVLRILIFDLMFIAFYYIISTVGGALIQQLLAWLFDTAFFTTLSVYVLNAFREFSKPSAANE